MLKCVLAVFGLAVAALVVFYVACYYWPPKVKIKCHRDDVGRLLIDVKPNWRVNGVYAVELWVQGDDRYLWALDHLPDGRYSLTYGEVPAGARQTYPFRGAPPRDVPADSVLCVWAEHQYDIPIPPMPCSGNDSAKFRLLGDGTIENLGKATYKDRLPAQVPRGPGWVIGKDPNEVGELVTVTKQVVEQNHAAIKDCGDNREEALRLLKDEVERLAPDAYRANRELAEWMLGGLLEGVKLQEQRMDELKRMQNQ